MRRRGGAASCATGASLGTVRDVSNYPTVDVLVVTAADGGEGLGGSARRRLRRFARLGARRDRARRRSTGSSAGELPMRVDVVTLFPEIFDGFLDDELRRARAARAGSSRCASGARATSGSASTGASTTRRTAAAAGWSCGSTCSSRAWSRSTPTRPEGKRAHRVLLTPQGRPFDQAKARELAARDAVMLVCGRYEGFDERVRAHVDEEISLGDFVMTGGEVAAMAVVEACVRLLPGVLGNEASTARRVARARRGAPRVPAVHAPRRVSRGRRSPRRSSRGNHAEIAKWRRAQAEERTRERRPDLCERYVRGQANEGAREAPRDRARALPGARQQGATVTSAITNLDVHDLARSARTYGCTRLLPRAPHRRAARSRRPHLRALARRVEREAHPRSQDGAGARQDRSSRSRRSTTGSAAARTSRCG